MNDVSVFKSLLFTVHTNTIGLRFQMSLLWRSFSNVCVFDRGSVHDRRKRIEKYAFSNENALVWTRPKLVGRSVA